MAKGFLNAQTIMSLVNKAALAAPAVFRLLEPRDMKGKLQHILMDYTGFDIGSGNWDWQSLLRGWMPYISSKVITTAISKISGMIRRI